MSFEDSGKKPVTVGPWGGSAGSRWDDGVYSTVKQVVIVHGAGIDSIKVEYDHKGCSIWSDTHGGSGGLKTDKVKLDYPDEYLTAVHGYYGSLNLWGTTFVRSLSFESNKKKYGPFGVEEGTHFSFPMTGGKIVGFHGRCGWYLDAIGVYLKPLQQKKPSNNDLLHSQNKMVNTINPSQNHLSNTNEKMGYSILQGSMGENFDIVLAVRQKDGFGKPIPNNFPASPKITEVKEAEPIKHHREKVPIPVKCNKEKVPDTIKDHKEKVHNPIKDHKEKVHDPIKDHKEKIACPDKVPSKVEGVVTYGPWGGNGGSIFDDGAYTGVRQINLSRNVGIVWIRVLYDQNGEAIWGSKQGGTGGFKTDKIVFDFPSEVLTHISGYYVPVMYMGPATIRSLTFHTTKRVYGPFGDEQGTHFTTKLKEGKVVGIHGRKGLFLDAIGVHVIEGNVITPAPTTPSNAIVPVEPGISELDNALPGKLVLAKQAPLEEVSYGVVKEPAPCGPGPWGGDGGRPWDDGVFSGIKQIYLTRVSEAICSIQIEYDRNGQSVWSVKHGSNGGETIHRIKLEYPHEMLTCISGYYGPIAKDERQVVIKSLTFFTSRGKYGPYGGEVGKFFTSTTTEGKVVGFHGKSSLYLDAIGVHMQHWLGNQKASKSSLFKLF